MDPRKLVALLLAVCVVVALAATAFVMHDLPDVEELADYRPAETTRIFDHQGELIATLFEENRTPVQLEQVSPHVYEALIAIEDERFYEHKGVDWLGVGRAAIRNVSAGGVEEGASTITMQLARNLFLTSERTLTRKLKETVLADRIESRFGKDEILEMYLNEVYFGAGAYGIKAAASRYFGKAPEKLTVAEAALLAGLVQAPSALNPFENRKEALERQHVVLEKMRDQGFIDQREYQKARTERLVFSGSEPAAEGMLKVPYFSTYAIHQLSQRYPRRQLYRQGLKIYTTVDAQLQRRAEEIVSSIMAEAGPGYNADSAALVLIENETGAIRAMVGGRGWSDKNQFNRAWQARRQPGSAFKPFVYATALEMGYTPNTLVEDKALEVDGWRPVNSDGNFMGIIPLRTALKHSRNSVAVSLIQDVGPERVVDLASDMGLPDDLPAYPSLALGAGEVSPLEMAQAYSVFARGGAVQPVRGVEFVQDRDGKLLEDLRHQGTRGHALSAYAAAGITEMLLEAVRGGTGVAAAVDGHDVAGKTGTTDQFRDAWFVGYTPRYTLAVWVGNDDHGPTWGVYGGTVPATIFREVMTEALAGLEPEVFEGLGPRAQQATLCSESHLLALPGCPRVHLATFYTEPPQRVCTLHGKDKKKKVEVEVIEVNLYGNDTVTTEPSPESTRAPWVEEPAASQLPPDQAWEAGEPVEPPAAYPTEPAPSYPTSEPEPPVEEIPPDQVYTPQAEPSPDVNYGEPLFNYPTLEESMESEPAAQPTP